MWGYGVYGVSIIKYTIQYNYAPNHQSEKAAHASYHNTCRIAVDKQVYVDYSAITLVCCDVILQAE